MSKSTTSTTNMVQYNIEEDLQFNIAKAAFAKNPFITWTEFILTDDQPNGNKQRVPESEFDNLLRTGIYMPIKMAESEINPGHDDSKPLGVITNLQKDGNKIIGLAALWEKERPEDVKLIKQKFANGESIDLSWELAYTDSIVDESGIENLLGCSLLATTVVGIPAYAGRTPIIAVASKWSRAYINDLPDSAFLFIESGGEKDSEGKTTPRSLRHLPYKDKEGNVDLDHLRSAAQLVSKIKLKDGSSISESQIKKLKKKINMLLQKHKEAALDELEKLQKDLEDLREEKTSLASALEAEKEKLASLEEELDELRAFKAEVERKEAEASKLESIKQRFESANIHKPDEYFEENKEKFLSMDEASLDFFIQELIAFAAKANASQLPRINSDDSEEKVDLRDLVEYLKKRK